MYVFKIIYTGHRAIVVAHVCPVGKKKIIYKNHILLLYHLKEGRMFYFTKEVQSYLGDDKSRT